MYYIIEINIIKFKKRNYTLENPTNYLFLFFSQPLNPFLILCMPLLGICSVLYVWIKFQNLLNNLLFIQCYSLNTRTCIFIAACLQLKVNLIRIPPISFNLDYSPFTFYN